MPATALGQLVNKIAQVQRDEDPSIDFLLLRCPWLAKVDWINRCPSEKWAPVVSSLSTSQLEWLVKTIVIAERIWNNWGAGSVASAIHLFRMYQQRDDGDWRQLADWILRNRGRNNYSPFGFRTAARSLAGWYSEQEETKKRYEAHLLRQQNEQLAKVRRIQAAQDLHVTRRKQSAQRKSRLTVILAQLREIPVQERLAFIAKKRTLPLDAIPKDIIQPCLSTGQTLEAKVRETLLKRIGRRKAGIWKTLRTRLNDGL